MCVIVSDKSQSSAMQCADFGDDPFVEKQRNLWSVRRGWNLRISVLSVLLWKGGQEFEDQEKVVQRDGTLGVVPFPYRLSHIAAL